MGRLVCMMVIGGEESLRVLTTAPGVVPRLVKKTPGLGKPYWYWPSIPAGAVVAADFTDAPIATSDEAQNAAEIEAITATPQEKLTYG